MVTANSSTITLQSLPKYCSLKRLDHHAYLFEVRYSFVAALTLSMSLDISQQTRTGHMATKGLFIMPYLRHLRKQCSLRRTSQTICTMPQSCLLKPTIHRPDPLLALPNIAQFLSQHKAEKKNSRPCGHMDSYAAENPWSESQVSFRNRIWFYCDSNFRVEEVVSGRGQRLIVECFLWTAKLLL